MGDTAVLTPGKTPKPNDRTPMKGQKRKRSVLQTPAQKKQFTSKPNTPNQGKQATPNKKITPVKANGPTPKQNKFTPNKQITPNQKKGAHISPGKTSGEMGKGNESSTPIKKGSPPKQNKQITPNKQMTPKQKKGAQISPGKTSGKKDKGNVSTVKQITEPEEESDDSSEDESTNKQIMEVDEESDDANEEHCSEEEGGASDGEAESASEEDFDLEGYGITLDNNAASDNDDDADAEFNDDDNAESNHDDDDVESNDDEEEDSDDDDEEEDSDDDVKNDDSVLDENDDDASESDEEKEVPSKKLKITEAQEKKNFDNTNVIFVGNVCITTTKQMLTNYFKKHGKVVAVWFRSIPILDTRIPRSVAAKTKQFHPKAKTMNAYVRFETRKSVETAVAAENGKVFNGKHIRVSVCDSQPDQQKRDNDKTIFIGNISAEAEEEDLWKIFESCGNIHSVRIVKDRTTNVSKGFGFVNFESPDSTELAMQLTPILFSQPLRIQAYSQKKGQHRKNNKETWRQTKSSAGGKKPFNPKFQKKFKPDSEGNNEQKRPFNPKFQKSFKPGQKNQIGTKKPFNPMQKKFQPDQKKQQTQQFPTIKTSFNLDQKNRMGNKKPFNPAQKKKFYPGQKKPFNKNKQGGKFTPKGKKTQEAN